MQRLSFRQHVRGFTLIELMIVVAVVAILAAVAIPSYAEHVRKSRRAQAKADLVEVAQLMERYHTVQNTYVGYTLTSNQSPRDGTAQYTVSLGNQTASTFTLTATPGTNQSKDKCGTMTLDQAGRKTPDHATVDGCW
ncbi:type IV pilin protein [Stenotrophomonas bentonitica]|uniref:type IV pilin protein n=1 Tax=Stenotrophomonas bentonitica TaxID=1450134 RepID=UPI00345E89E9